MEITRSELWQQECDMKTLLNGIECVRNLGIINL